MIAKTIPKNKPISFRFNFRIDMSKPELSYKCTNRLIINIQNIIRDDKHFFIVANIQYCESQILIKTMKIYICYAHVIGSRLKTPPIVLCYSELYGN